jgi:mannose/fructose/N-acetylgalactosamine-specific phosphotransferase system component IID
MKKTVLTATLLWAIPFFAFAQGVQGLVNKAGDLLNSLIPLLIALALVIFFWGLIKYSGEGGHGTGRNIMIAGIVALFIMVSIWGIIRLLQNTLLEGGNGGPIQAPCVADKNNNCL